MTERWQHIKTLLHQAMQLEPAQRGAFLDQACAVDPSMRVELESLLVADGRIPANFLLHAAVQPGIAASEADAFAAALEAGQLFAQRFRLVRRLGEGGMGQLWLADQLSPVQRAVALKLIKAGMYDQAVVQRFQAERQSLAIMDHPTIAKVYEAGTTAQGQPYLVMEYVPGLAITDYCEQRRLSIRARLELFVKACDGVQHAHQKAIIHRDLKPQNILVVEVDGEAVPRIIDFGLAKAITPQRADHSVLTQMGHFLGTPGYMSPEQIDLNVPDIDARSDVYSLGVVLYVLLSGSQPFESKPGQQQPIDVLLRKLREEEPPNPSTKISSDRDSSSATAAARGTEPRQLASLLRGDLDDIAQKALERDRNRRYDTASELAADIRRHLRHEPILARPPSAAYRLGKYARRHRLAVAVGVAVILLLTAFAALQTVELRQTGRERDRANRERDRALSLLARNQAVQEFMDLLITEAAQSDKPVSVSDMLARSEMLANCEFHDDPEDRAAVLDMLGSHFHTIGDETRAQPLLQQAIDAISGSPDQDLRGQVRCDRAITIGTVGRQAEAEAELRTVAMAPETSDEQAANCLEYLSYLAQNANDSANALKYSKLALERLQRAPHEPPALVANFIGSVAYAEHLGGDNADAERDFAQSLEMFARGGREHSANAIAVRNNSGIVSDGAGDSRRALEIFQQTLQLLQQDASHPQIPAYLVANLGRQLENVGRYQEARAHYTQCVQLAQQSGVGAQVMYCLAGLASVSISQGNLNAAKGYLGQADAIAAGAVPAGSPAALGLLLTQGRLALESGAHEAARAALSTVIEGQRPIATTVRALLARAELCLRESKFSAAAEDAHSALSIAQTLQGGVAYSSRTGLAWLMIGHVLAAQGDGAGARNAFQSAVDHLPRTVDATHPALLDAQRQLGGGGRPAGAAARSAA